MRALRSLANVLYPPACSLCQTRVPSPDEVLCVACLRAMPESGPPVCARCGLSLAGAFDAVLVCASCRRTPFAFEQARAPWRYAGVAQEAIQQFKYHRRWRIGRWLAGDMMAVAQAAFPVDEIHFVAPVPLHWLKHRAKGYNPAGELAAAVSQALDKPYRPGALRRVRWTPTQTRLQGRSRFRNVQGAFTADAHTVRDQTVLLIDDVLTSGATANACALALKQAGARAVFVLTAARTPLAPRSAR